MDGIEQSICVQEVLQPKLLELKLIKLQFLELKLIKLRFLELKLIKLKLVKLKLLKPNGRGCSKIIKIWY